MATIKKYEVKYEIELQELSPKQAAKEALDYLNEKGNGHIFSVRELLPGGVFTSWETFYIKGGS